MSDTPPKESALEFPCAFPIKTFGSGAAPEFEQIVYDLVKPHVPELAPSDISHKQSSSGRYLSVTVDIIARSQTQLDAIYQDLSDSTHVLMSL